ncbi:hypothetical protein J7400_11355 [Shimia sp. R9_2]|uniref:hypothetical protein n=1 Tax=Shimia sp. R9_2 TaxID=2821112 RepID=UPI001AD9E70F|nr:hypothetical protein [Shimia sp. R9_2]MBO9397279.1 hypothetical protein [Shimia sp. R9_2]
MATESAREKEAAKLQRLAEVGERGLHRPCAVLYKEWTIAYERYQQNMKDWKSSNV